MSSVGSRVPRRDGASKVTGSARYIDDLSEPGMLHGWTVRSTVAKGIIDSIELDPEYDWSDVVVVTADDIEAMGGENVVHLMTDDQPCLAPGRINHIDEPVAVVAAATRELAHRAAQHVIVNVTAQTPVLDMRLADQNASTLTLGRGDLDAAFERADHIFESSYSTGAQEQLYIEMQGMMATPVDGGGLVLRGSLQCPFYVHRAIKRLLKLDDGQVAVIQTVTGGGFGGKEEYPSILAGHVALLALKSGRPVKMVYDRDEDLRATTKRHPSVV